MWRRCSAGVSARKANLHGRCACLSVLQWVAISTIIHLHENPLAGGRRDRYSSPLFAIGAPPAGGEIKMHVIAMRLVCFRAQHGFEDAARILMRAPQEAALHG